MPTAARHAHAEPWACHPAEAELGTEAMEARMSPELSKREPLDANGTVHPSRRVPFWRRVTRRGVAKYLGVAGVTYVAAFLVLLAAENKLLFSGALVARTWHEPADSLRVRDITLNSADAQIHAWFSVPPGWEPRQGAVLISHGNGDNLLNLADCVGRWRDRLGRAVLVYDYPGYGKSTGRPSEAGCYAAGEAALRWLTEDQHVPDSEIILVGESMGGAIAVELATRHPVRLLVLHSAFTSFPDVAQAHVPWFPARYVVRNQMRNIEKIPNVHAPVLMTHGTADRTVPFPQGERLFAAANEPKQFIRMEGEGHYPPVDAGFFDAVRQFLAKTRR
jgi:uncharacterized protein